MSKTTLFLLTILALFLGFLLFVIYEPKQNALITSLTSPENIPQKTADAMLSLTATTQTFHPGQTATLSVLIHNAIPHPYLVQFELAYDPLMVTVTSITPGAFFTNPVIALQKIDSLSGRITYALHCPTEADCSNTAVVTLANITININPYAAKNSTSISFLQKSVIRTNSNTDILKKTNGLQLAFDKPFIAIPLSSSSAIASQAAR